MKKIYILFLFSLVYTQDEYLVTIPAVSYSDWIYFSIENNSIVDVDNPSTSFGWDLAFQRKHIRTNSGLSGSGNGGASVDSSMVWLDEWANINEIPENVNWMEDVILNDFYEPGEHIFIEGIKNPALNAWGWFDEAYHLNTTNYVMFVKCANGNDVIKFWAYDYYENSLGGYISFRYQTGFTLDSNIECSDIIGDINNDQLVNVIDVVSLVNFILEDSYFNECQLLSSDFNNDEDINVIDVVALVNLILN